MADYDDACAQVQQELIRLALSRGNVFPFYPRAPPQGRDKQFACRGGPRKFTTAANPSGEMRTFGVDSHKPRFMFFADDSADRMPIMTDKAQHVYTAVDRPV